MNETPPFIEPEEKPTKPDSVAAEAEADEAQTAELDDTALMHEPTDTAIINTGTSQKEAVGVEPTLRAGMRCDVGARERNEDSCLVFSSEAGGHFSLMPFGLYIVADGMGGHTNGHVASRIASRVAAHYILSKIYMPLLQTVGPPTQVPIQEVLLDAAQAANTAVFEDDPDVDSGTTLTVALVLGRRLHVAHVGDSRLYLLADGKLEQITNDHSLVQRLQDVGTLTAEEATMYRYRNVLLRAVGQGEEVEVDTYMRLLPHNGKLLLCSDGLCGFVSDEMIQKILEKDSSLPQMVDDLYETALASHSNDNVTAVVVDYSL
ncbi:MAG: serine/threonine-protein phosphatase [Ardenticatenaceae bacterium]|nr:serine/threonine-protein phosphatase [Anaerolineales bacterium]MCB8939008.1 serine/threonine-protein phosphatase [Ardenticatenaceae bacterium]MCB8974764.1 serine/threonine-protein phosphatase [Ardenticatenaceae bacterium]